MRTPCPLEDGHDTSNFSCGVEVLDTYLKRYAGQAQRRSGARTYVALQGNRVAGYYTLVFGGVAWTDAPERVPKGLGKYLIPIILIARLAVDKKFAGKGLGNSLLIDALRRSLAASEIAGLRAVVVDAKDAAAKRFYESRGFRIWADSSNRLFITMTELKRESDG